MFPEWMDEPINLTERGGEGRERGERGRGGRLGRGEREGRGGEGGREERGRGGREEGGGEGGRREVIMEVPMLHPPVYSVHYCSDGTSHEIER